MDVTLFLTHQCNLRCEYCYNGAKRDQQMSADVMRRAIEMACSQPGPLGDDSSAYLSFFGGEPLLEYEGLQQGVALARELEQRSADRRVRFALTTNGTLLDDAKLAFLRDEQFHLLISIDGCRRAHEVARPFADGGSSYDRVVESVQRALQTITNTETMSVVHAANASLLPESVAALLDLGVHHVNLCFDYDAAWTDAQLDELDHALARLGDETIARFRAGQDFDLEPIDSRIRSHLTAGFPVEHRCHFGRGELAVAPSGRLYPCERLVREDRDDELCIGHVTTGVELAKVAAMCKRIEALDPECQQCQLNTRCMHWCGCVNYATSGDVGGPGSLLCRLEQALIRAADHVASTLYAENNAAFCAKFYAASGTEEP